MRAIFLLFALILTTLLAACGTEDADLNPPVFTLFGPSSTLLNQPSKDSPVELSGTLDDPAATVEVEINGSAAPAGAFSLSADGNWTLSFTPIEGTNTVSLTASDKRGNINQLAFSLVHDGIAPTIISVTPSTDPLQLVVVFSEKLDKASAETLTAYGISGASITAATLDSETTALTVTLTLTQALAPGPYKLGAAGIKDLSLPDGNATAAAYAFEFTLP